MNYRPWISGSEPTYDWRWPHYCLSAVHGCRLSATELFLSPLPAPGTTCRATSRPHHLCLFSEDAPLSAFVSVPSVQCLHSDFCHCWHSNGNRTFYLLTYIESNAVGSNCLSFCCRRVWDCLRLEIWKSTRWWSNISDSWFATKSPKCGRKSTKNRFGLEFFALYTYIHFS